MGAEGPGAGCSVLGDGGEVRRASLRVTWKNEVRRKCDIPVRERAGIDHGMLDVMWLSGVM